MNISSKLLSLTFLLLTACVTNERAGDMDWGDSHSQASPETKKKAEPIAEQTSDEATLEKDAQLTAKKMRDDIDCEKETERLSKLKLTSEAWHLLRACTKQAKWRNLRRLASPAFAKRMSALGEKERMLFVAEVVANRGGVFEIDLPDAQDKGWALHGVPTAIKKALPAGSLVMFRADLASQSVEGGKHEVVLQEVARKTEDHKETFLLQGQRTGNIYVVEAKTGSSDLLEETGVEIHGTLDAPHPKEDAKPMIYLGRLLERPAKQTLVMELLGVYTAGPILVDISR